jgi:transcriptional antiterminator NusG
VNDFRWYAARTQPRHEKKILEHLTYREVESFLPIYLAARRWNNGTKANVELPLYPGYLFVRTSLQRRIPILSVPGLIGLVGCGGCPSPIADQDIELLATGIVQLKPEPHPYVKIGDLVRVRSGPLAGREGFLVRKKENSRFVLSMDLLMQAVSVEIDATDLEHLNLSRSA